MASSWRNSKRKRGGVAAGPRKNASRFPESLSVRCPGRSHYDLYLHNDLRSRLRYWRRRAGVRLGIMFGIVYTGANLISYGAQPFPAHLITVYSIAGLIEYAIVGAIVGAIYKRGLATPG